MVWIYDGPSLGVAMITRFIDPSINNIGWADYSADGDLIDFGTFHPKAIGDEARLIQISQWLYIAIGESEIGRVVIERSEAWTRKGFGGQSLNTGSLAKLFRAIGALIGAAAIGGCLVEEYTWKTTMRKGETKRTMVMVYGARINLASQHALDAVHMGHRWMSDDKLRRNVK